MRVAHVVFFTALSFIPLTARSQAQPTSRGPIEGDSITRLMQSPGPEPLKEGELLPALEQDSGSATGLGLSDLEQMALENNPTLAQARARVRAAQGVWTQVGLYPNPAIAYLGEEMGSEGASGQQGGLLGQTLVTGGKLRLNRAVVSQDIVRLRQEFAAQQCRVLTDVRTGYYSVLVAQRRIALAEQLVDIGQKGVRTAEALLKAQEASLADLLQARVELNTTRILLENAQNQRHAAWQGLSSVVGIPNMETQHLQGEIDQPTPALHWQDVLDRLLSDSPELAAAHATVARARWALERARVQWIPDVGLEVSLQHDNSNGDNITSAGVALPLPLFNRNQGNITAAGAQLVAAQRNVARLRLNLQNRLAEVFRKYANARQQVEKYRNCILPDAKKTLDLMVEGYQKGEFGYLNLLTVQRTYFQSSLAYVDALLQEQLARTRIDGLLLSQSLGGMPSSPSLQQGSVVATDLLMVPQ